MMLEFNRRQMDGIGELHLRQSLQGFLTRHLPQASQMPKAQLRDVLEQTLGECRQLGLTSQRAIAAYTLAASALGSETLRGDPTVQDILAQRQLPQAHKALLLQTWLAQMGAELARLRS